MERHAFVAKLSRQYRNQYIDAHRNVPPELLDRYRRAGILNVSVFLHEDVLFLHVESNDYAAAQAALENDPIELAWAKLIDPMLDDGGYRECIDLFHMD